jgi:hypothetical protein
LGTHAWHKIVLKVGPDAEAVSNGIGIWLSNHGNEHGAPQTGFAIKVQNANGMLDEMAVPPDGRITLRWDHTAPQLYQQLLSPTGLTLFLKRDSRVTESHTLSLELLKKREWYEHESKRIAMVDLLPVDINVSKEGTSAAPHWTGGLVVKKTDTVRYRLSPGVPDVPLLLEDKIRWHWRILKWDGTYSDWTAYQDGQGHTFTAQPEDAGIYEVKATFDGQDFFLKRKNDDLYSTKKTGEKDCFGVVDEEWQISVREKAALWLGNEDYAQAKEKQPIPENQPKCNLFVAHCGTLGGAEVPWINGGSYFIGALYPPVANQWAGKKVNDILKHIPNWTLLPEETYPQPGWIVARAGKKHGHTGIIDYDGAWIGAGPINVNRKADLRNDISLRSGPSIYQPARFRKYTP